MPAGHQTKSGERSPEQGELSPIAPFAASHSPPAHVEALSRRSKSRAERDPNVVVAPSRTLKSLPGFTSFLLGSPPPVARTRRLGVAF
jgi:hypothetical protein